ncbi:MAG: cation-translocating P-type ATPase [Halanaerobiaceae bacterium]
MAAEESYYRLPAEKILNIFDSSIDRGLKEREIKSRQHRHGVNELPEKKSRGIIAIFLDQFQDFMIIVLLAATVLSLFMGEIADAVTIFAIVILNAVMGFVQEYRAEKSLAALKKLTTPEALAVRGGEIKQVRAEDLVPGDILLLEAGDRVPADARILKTDGLQVDESVLTGESVPVAKIDGRIYARDVELADRTNMVFMGSIVTRGKARVVVTETGSETEMGKIAGMLDDDITRLTPLQKRLKTLGKWLVLMSVLITISIMIIGVFKGQSIYQMFLAGVSLAVAAIPEGLPAIVTLALAIGVQKMIRRNAIVRQLPAVETLGCATVICSDKTGTLTENSMQLKKVYLNHRVRKFTPELNTTGLEKMLYIGGLCNSARSKKKMDNGSTFSRIKQFFAGDREPEFIGDPTDVALINALYKYGLPREKIQEQYEVKGEVAFNPERKRMSVLVQSGRKQEVWTKGAPEVILERSNHLYVKGNLRELTPTLKREIKRAADGMGEDALRVLGVAYRPLPKRIRTEKLQQEEDNLIFIGLVGLLDPPRPEAYRAVERCKKAGIRPVMITGDHRVTARVIARELGIIEPGDRVVEGRKVSEASTEEIKEMVKKVKVFARVSPADKLKIVEALRGNGEIVAMTGDGVNDAPAVKEADIGVAMGKNGTDVTREVSSLILSDDNFATIVAAVEEGRIIYNNIRKFIRYLLSCNIGELLSIFMGIVMGLPLPLVPLQILWVNLVTDGLPALALGMGGSSEEVMNVPPRNPEESIFARGLIGKIINQGMLIGIFTMLAFLIALFRLQLDVEAARTMAFSTLVFSQLVFVFSCRSEKGSILSGPPGENPYLILAVLVSIFAQFLVLYLPVLSSFFHTVILTPYQWGIVVLFSLGPTFLMEIIQYLFRRNLSS